MSKEAAEHHRKASEHHAHAARHHEEAAKLHENGRQEQTATGRLSGNDPGRRARQSASARSSSATRARTVGMSATRLNAATAIACRSDLPAAVALSS